MIQHLREMLLCALLLRITCVSAFAPITFDTTSTMTFDEGDIEIGWIKFSWCDSTVEFQGSVSAAPHYHSDYTQEELFDLTRYAVTAQIGPNSIVPGINESADYTTTAKLCSNPIYALNNQYEMSFTVNMSTSDPVKITDFGNRDFWIGTADAVQYMNQTCMFHSSLSDDSLTDVAGVEPKALENVVYETCGTGDDLNENGDWGKTWCTLRFMDQASVAEYDVGVWLGFDINHNSYCQFDEYNAYSFMADPTPHPTNLPTTVPTVPSSPSTFYPIVFDFNSTVNFDGVNVTIGWLQFLWCNSTNTEALYSAAKYNTKYTEDTLFNLTRYAVTAQIGPKSNVPGITENADYTTTARLCSNPIFALNNQYEMSFTVNMTSDPTKVIGWGNESDWMGSSTAVEYMTQSCMFHSTQYYGIQSLESIIGLTPKALENAVYDGCGINDDLNENGDWEPHCALRWNSNDDPGYDIGVWLGFDINRNSYCQFDDDGSYTALPLTTLNPTNAPTADPSNEPSANPTQRPTSEPTNDPTSPPSLEPTDSPSMDPTLYPSNEPSANPSQRPTEPTADPTRDPTTLPTNEPTHLPSLSEFRSSVTASFNITGWTSSQISEVSEDIELFTNSLTTYVHQGLDNDDHFELQSVLPNIKSIDDHHLNDLLTMDDSKSAHILYESLDRGMDVQCHINCSIPIKCIILADDSSNGIDRSEFEEFVSDKLNLHFLSTDASTSGSSGLVLVIEDITLNGRDDSITTTTVVSEKTVQDNDESKDGRNETSTVLIAVAGISFVILVASLYFIYRKYLRKSPLTISNALVTMVSIGDYSDGATMTDKEVKGEFINLPVEKDTENLKELCSFMGWTFVSKGQKVHWTEKEIMFFIQTEIGEMMFTADGSLNFDGLIVCLSGHGIKDKIVSSDFKAMEKIAIHRVLSMKYPNLREIPRIFVFDCCSGSDERRVSIHNGKDESKAIELTVPSEQNKNIALHDLQHLNDQQSWTTSTKNPDYNLVEVHAANSGYAAKMSYKGSYLVYLLAKAIKLSVTNLMTRGLAELLEDVQNALHDKGHQQTVNILNNHTRTLLFKKNKRK